MIICGFWGIGKTFCADNFPRVLDFEGRHMTGYDSNRIMIDTIKMFDFLKYDVILDIRLLKILKESDIDFTVVIPSIDQKDVYMKRYESMGYDDKTFNLILDSWEDTIHTILLDYDIRVVTLQSGEYLSNVFLKWSNGFKENYGVSLINRNELLDKLRQVDSVDWEYGNAKDKVFNTINDMKEYHISRKDII